MYTITHQRWSEAAQDYEHKTVAAPRSARQVTETLHRIDRRDGTAYEHYVTEWDGEEILSQTNGEEWLHAARPDITAAEWHAEKP